MANLIGIACCGAGLMENFTGTSKLGILQVMLDAKTQGGMLWSGRHGGARKYPLSKTDQDYCKIAPDSWSFLIALSGYRYDGKGGANEKLKECGWEIVKQAKNIHSAHLTDTGDLYIMVCDLTKLTVKDIEKMIEKEKAKQNGP